ncbi:importin subunit alpha-8 [Capsella rubella]|uniref:importin subunit alpha-8 n=1 Tax=Capsella rubella TaxID=81985 RepID=UPI000CD5AE87|nr:importin subunit alpha-8 [Capsella rubella]
MFSEDTSLLADLSSDDDSRKLGSATKINEILLKSMPGIADHDTQELIQSGVIYRLVCFLGAKDFSRLHYQAASCLTRIAVSKPDLVVAYDAVPGLVKLLASNRDYVRDQAIWAICNVAVHPIHRDYVLNSGALVPLLNLLSKNINLPTLRFATLTLCHLCRGTPPPIFEQKLESRV